MFERIIGSTIGYIAGAIAGKIENIEFSAEERRLYEVAQIKAMEEIYGEYSSSASMTSSSYSSSEPRPIPKPKPPPPEEFFKEDEFNVK